jgi:cytochrome bd-type quinol oxidase subunit 2
MNKSKKVANWAWIGSFFIVFSIVNLVVYLLTGSGLDSRMNHSVKGGLAVLGSVVFFVMGIVCLGIWLLLKTTRASKQDRNRWRQ